LEKSISEYVQTKYQHTGDRTWRMQLTVRCRVCSVLVVTGQYGAVKIQAIFKYKLYKGEVGRSYCIVFMFCE